jgi:hypothetical protein
MEVGALVVNIMGVGSSVGDCDGTGPQEARINTRSNGGLRILVKGHSFVDPLHINEEILSDRCRGPPTSGQSVIRNLFNINICLVTVVLTRSLTRI